MARKTETSVASSSAGYRRGVIFGLTMAEILLLLLFCLLLFINFLYREQEKRNIELNEKQAQVEEIKKELETTKATLTKSTDELRQDNALLKEKLKNSETAFNNLMAEKNVALPDEILEALKKNLNSLKAKAPTQYSILIANLKNDPDTIKNSSFIKIDEFQATTTIKQFIDALRRSDLFPLLNEKTKEQIYQLEQKIIVITSLEKISPDLLTSEEKIKELTVIFAENLDLKKMLKDLEEENKTLNEDSKALDGTVAEINALKKEKNKIEKELKATITKNTMLLEKERDLEKVKKEISNIANQKERLKNTVDNQKKQITKMLKDSNNLRKDAENRIAQTKKVNTELRKTNERLIDINKNLRTKEKLSKGPPIINLPEAEEFSFRSGKAVLSEAFSQRLKTDIKEKILVNLREYDANIIEVIGHTDEVAVTNRKEKRSSLDANTINFILGQNSTPPSAVDNAGLGLARASAVIRVLRSIPELSNYEILPYSAGQLILPNETLTNGQSILEDDQRRRIEIRVRRRKKD